jgi:hypothetical protein
MDPGVSFTPVDHHLLMYQYHTDGAEAFSSHIIQEGLFLNFSLYCHSWICDLFSPLKHKIHLNKIQQFSTSLTENTLDLYYKDKPVTAA